MSYGTLNYLADVPRYTTLDAVKEALGVSDVAADVAITQAIAAAELQIDIFNGRSFPDDPLTEPIHGDEIDGIPSTISVWALDASISVYKLRDLTVGAGGSDGWIGTIDVQDEVRRSLRRNPLALGYKVSWGVA